MNLKKSLSIGLLILLLPLQVLAADRYWVGDTGDWEDNVNHWAASSGGAPNETEPGANDDVYVDANSFSGSGSINIVQTLEVGDSFDFTGLDELVTLYHEDTCSLFTIRGGFIGNSNLTVDKETFDYLRFFDAGAESFTVTNNGTTWETDIKFKNNGGEGAGWTLLDTLATTGDISLLEGLLDINGQTITMDTLNSDNTDTRVLTLGNSTINCAEVDMETTTNLTFNADTSTINCTGNFQVANDAGNDLTFATVNFNGSGARNVRGSSTFGTLNSDTTAKTMTIEDGTTQTITTWGINGDEGNLITLVSETPGTPYSFSVGAGTVDCSFCDVTDMTVAGGAKFMGGENGGGNTGWYRFESDARGLMSF